MIPGGWNSQREVSNVQHNPGPVKGTLDGIVKREASITQQDPGNVEDAMKENEMIPGPWWKEQSDGSQKYS